MGVGSLVLHHAADGLGDNEGADEIDVHDAAEFGDGHFQRRLALDDAGGVDGDVEAAEHLMGMRDSGGDAALAGDVNLHGVMAVAKFLLHGVHLAGAG